MSLPSDPGLRGARGAATSPLGRILIILIATIVFKLGVGALGSAAPGWLGALDTAGSVVLVAALGYILVRILALLRRRLLWRVRRRLVLSYILIGFVPIVLIVAFFLLGGMLVLGTVKGSLVQLGFHDVVDDAADLVATTVVDLRGAVDAAAVRAVLERRIQAVEERYAFASLAVVPRAEGSAPLDAAGSWRHMAGPPGFPGWLAQDGGGIVMTGSPGSWAVVARSAAVIDVAGSVVAVVADLPLAGDVVARVQASGGIELIDMGVTTAVGGCEAGANPAAEDERVSLGPDKNPAAATFGFAWNSDVDLLDWTTGEYTQRDVNFRVDLAPIYDQVVRGGETNFSSVFFLVLMALGLMFLTIEAVALFMGFALAKSITGAVHELFTGTERVRRGDFFHRIRVETPSWVSWPGRSTR